jgi:nitrogen fixation/metabolism regulation signal transduction histidine kinase
VQAFQNILQSALSSVLEKLTLPGRPQSYRPLIEVDLQILENEFLISILDNGRGPDSTPSLEIPIASQILIEHGATLEILAPPQGLRMAKITVTRPVFTP